MRDLQDVSADWREIFSTRPNFIMPVQNFGGPPPKNFRGQKHAKFGPISDDFGVRWQIFLEWMKMFKVGKVHFVPQFLSHWAKQVRWTLLQ